MAENTFGSVCAVVVTYNIGNAFSTCFNSLKGQADHVVIVNTSTDGSVTSRVLEQIRAADPDFVDVLESPENNLGMAQNMGIRHALESGYDWVLLLDHDSRLGAGMLSAMEQAYWEDRRREKIGILAPCLEDTNVGNPPLYLRAWYGYWFEQKGFDNTTPVIDHVLYVPASGSLMPARVFKEHGYMDESLVIDHIDTDFGLRLTTSGLRILAVRDAKLYHRIGERKTHRFLGFRVTTTNHPPLRRYYHYRNRLKMWRRYGVERPSFFIFDLLRTVYELWRILLFESNKNAKMEQVGHGVWDGLCGVKGPKPGMATRRR